jgi:DNA-binding transcriptional MerR regulator
MDALMTVGELAATLRVPQSRLKYLIQTCGIREVQRAGTIRLFSTVELDQIRRELRRRGWREDEHRGG